MHAEEILKEKKIISAERFEASKYARVTYIRNVQDEAEHRVKNRKK